MDSPSRKITLLILLFALAGFTICAQPPGVPANEAQDKIEAIADEALDLRKKRSYRGSYEKYLEAARQYRAAGEIYRESLALMDAGISIEFLAEKQEALKQYEAALLLMRRLREDSTNEEILKNRSFTYFEVVTYHKMEGRILNRIGEIAAEAGDRKKAISAYEDAVELCRRGLGSDAGCRGDALKGLANIYAALGERKKAFEYLNEGFGLKIDTDSELPTKVKLELRDPRFSWVGRGRETLIDHIDEALELWEQLGFDKQRPSVFNNPGNLNRGLRSLKNELEGFRQKLESGDLGSDTQREELRAKIGRALDDYGKAIADAIRIKGSEASMLSNLMHSEKRSGQAAIAIIYGKQCVNTYQELRRAAKRIDKETQKEFLKNIEDDYRFLADLLIEAGFFSQAEEVLQMLKEEEYSKFVKRDPEEIKSLARRVALSEKEIALVGRYAKLADRSAEIAAEFQKLEEKKKRNDASGLKPTPAEEKRYEEIKLQLADANAAFQLFIEKELKNEIGADAAKDIEADRGLQERLKAWGKGTVALYTVAGRDRYRVVLTTPNLQTDGKTEIKAADLNRKIFAFREALQNVRLDPRPLGKELYEILIKPIEKELKASGAKTLVWSLDGPLRYIPIAALSPDGESYLAERYENAVVTPKTRDGLAGRQTEWSALGMGVSKEQVISYPWQANIKVKVNALPETARELAAIIREEGNPKEKGIFPGKRYLDEGFTLENLTASLGEKNAAGGKKYKVVHLASHFRLGGNWSESFLLMGNGELLTLEEIINSEEIGFEDVELVTLSACNTGFGLQANGSEVDSLADAIQNKSGKAIMASLWEVADISTSEFMASFYRMRKENPGLTKAEAMSRAQKKMIEGNGKATGRSVGRQASEGEAPKFAYDRSRPFAHPYYWSGFILIGNWQ